MPTYVVFGLQLRSDIELGEAGPLAVPADARSGEGVAAPADCVLERRPGCAPELPQRFMGQETVTGDASVRCYETSEGFRLVYDDTGTFDVASSGAHVIWWSDGRATTDAVQTDVLGRVIALALHCRGSLTLHGSAVSVAGEGIVFLAPKFFGKSSLATALVRAGALLISDDTAAVVPGTPPMLHPGVQTLRLRHDSAIRNVIPADPGQTDKLRFRPPAASVVGTAATPLRGLYLLQPVAPQPADPPVTREPCSSVESVLAVTTFRKLGALLDGTSGARSLQAAAELVATVPVHRLLVQRSLERLDEVASQVVEWHTVADVAR